MEKRSKYTIGLLILLASHNNVLMPAVAAWETNYYEVSKILSIAAVGYLALTFCKHKKAWQQQTQEQQKVDALTRATYNNDKKAMLALLYSGVDSNKVLQGEKFRSKGKIPHALAPTHSFRVQLERERKALANLEVAQNLLKATCLAPLGRWTIKEHRGLPRDLREKIAGYLTVQESLVFKQAYKKRKK